MHWTKAYREIRADRSASYELRSALLSALDRDPIDALRDAETLCEVLVARCDEALGKGNGHVAGEMRRPMEGTRFPSRIIRDAVTGPEA